MITMNTTCAEQISIIEIDDGDIIDTMPENTVSKDEGTLTTSMILLITLCSLFLLLGICTLLVIAVKKYTNNVGNDHSKLIKPTIIDDCLEQQQSY